MSESIKFPKEVFDQVAADHQPQTVEAEVYAVIDRVEASLLRTERHVVFWDGGKVRSVLEKDWSAEQASLTAKEQKKQQGRQTRAAILATAQNAVGKAVGSLNANQREALLALLLWKAGGLNSDGTVKGLDEWVND